MTTTQKIALPLIAVILLATGAILYQLFATSGQPDRAQLLQAGIVLLPEQRDLPSIELTDQNGETVDVNALKDRWSLLFFGYTFCPDICPTTLTELRQLDSKLSPEVRERLRVILVTVDPNRDTPQQMKKYLEYFNPAFIGLTGEIDRIQQLAKRVSIPFIPPDTSKPGYTVDHSGNLVILGPDGQQRGFIRSPLRVDELAEQLPVLMKQSG